MEVAIHNNNAIKRIFHKIKTRKYIYKTRQIKLEMVLVSQVKQQHKTDFVNIYGPHHHVNGGHVSGRKISSRINLKHVEVTIHNNNAIKRIFYKIKTRKYIYKTRQIKLEMVLVSQVKQQHKTDLHNKCIKRSIVSPTWG